MTTPLPMLRNIICGACLTAAVIILLRLCLRRVLSPKAKKLSVAASGTAALSAGASGKPHQSHELYHRTPANSFCHQYSGL